jgi:hypothetical protein
MSLDLIFQHFGAINANAFYSILYFLKNNVLFFVVLIAIAYIIYIEIKEENDNFVFDERSVI